MTDWTQGRIAWLEDEVNRLQAHVQLLMDELREHHRYHAEHLPIVEKP